MKRRPARFFALGTAAFLNLILETERCNPQDEAEPRAWATVSNMTGGGKKSGSGRGNEVNKAPAKKGGRIGGAASAGRTAAERSASARKAAQTRASNAANKKRASS